MIQAVSSGLGRFLDGIGHLLSRAGECCINLSAAVSENSRVYLKSVDPRKVVPSSSVMVSQPPFEEDTFLNR